MSVYCCDDSVINFNIIPLRLFKKISKYFKDEKMDLIAKEKQWLLCSGDDIVWVVGRRADDRFKVRPGTTTILKITCTL